MTTNWSSMSPSATSIIDPAGPAAGAGEAARIGPNAVLQLIEALRAGGMADRLQTLFAAAGAADWLDAPPGQMVDERRVARLHRGVRASLTPHEAVALMSEAGRRTADYLLANRIPKPAQAVLKILPPRLAAEILVRAIRANAWTFAGSSRFEARAGSPTVFTLTGNPLCAGEQSPQPICAWHAAVFQRLFQELVSPRARAVETHCAAAGDPFCRFVVDWRPAP